MSEQLESTKASLERLQNYDVDSLPREKELGDIASFTGAVEPAQAIISIFRMLPIAHLDEFPDNELKVLQKQADGVYNLLESIILFDPATVDNSSAKRDQMINNLAHHRQSVFTSLSPLISYITSRMTDFSKLESDARAAVQGVKDEAALAAGTLSKHEQDAESILIKIQTIAAEQGVSQQASYYKGEADKHDKLARGWQTRTNFAAAGLGIFAFFSLYLHKWEKLGLIPETPYDTIQLALSKVLIFGVIAYLLVLCARNFLSHTHNAIVNRHRQNALLTFTSLVEAAKNSENQDIILTHAAECIFSPQETGYIKQTANAPSSVTQTVVRAMPRLLEQSAKDIS